MTLVVEWLPIALELAKDVQAITKFVYEGSSAAVQYGPGIEKLRLDLEIEVQVFDSMRDALFGGPHETPDMGIFRDFSHEAQIDIANRLRYIKQSLDAKLEIIEKKQGASRPTALDVVDKSVSFGAYHSASLFTRLRFGFQTKSQLQKSVDELRCGNERLQSLINIQLLRKVVKASKSPNADRFPLYKIERRAGSSSSAGHVDFNRFVRTAQIANTPAASKIDQQTQGPALQKNDVSQYDFTYTSSGPQGNHARGLCFLLGKQVLIEWRSFVPDINEDPPQSSVDRVERLAEILRQWDERQYRTLVFHEFFVHKESGRFGLTFQLPQHSHGLFKTLSEYLQSQKQTPDLDTRFFLARELASGLSQLHDVGWIHKSFHSDNVLFFEPEESETVPQSDVLYKSPRIMGWEYARPEGELSSRPTGFVDIGQDVYRHPSQWGLPTDRFSIIHDLYSLGVVLLEIGVWKPAIGLHERRFEGMDRASAVQAFLVQNASRRRLSVDMGKRYQQIVLKCLQGDFVVTAFNDQPLTSLVAPHRTGEGEILDMFRREVVEVLDDIVCHL